MITTNAKRLAQFLNKFLPIIPTKNVVEALQTLYIGVENKTLTVTASNIETLVRGTHEIENLENASFEFLVNAKEFYALISALGDAECKIIFEKEVQKITVKTKKGKYTLRTQSTDNFPLVNDFDDLQHAKEVCVLSWSELAKIQKSVVYATSNDEYRPAMMGVYFEFENEKAKATATDGFQLSSMILENESGVTYENESFILLGGTFSYVASTQNDYRVLVSENGRGVYFKAVDFMIYTRFVDEKFPAYKNVIPSDGAVGNIEFNKSELLGVLKRLKLFSGTANKIELEFSERLCIITANDLDTGSGASETISFKGNCDNLRVGVNVTLLIETISNIDSDIVQMVLFGATKPIIFDSHNKVALVMPLRL